MQKEMEPIGSRKIKNPGVADAEGRRVVFILAGPFFFFSEPPTEDDGDGTDVSVDVE